MTKGEFMRELERLLSKVPQNEKRDALEYYNDYFAEAGITDEMLVPSSMGTPGHIADTIIREAVYGEKDSASYTERGYADDVSDNRENSIARAETNKDKGDNSQSDANQKTGYYYENGINGNSAESKGTFTQSTANDNTKLIVAIVLLIVFSPAIIGAVSGIGGTLIGVFGALVGIIIGFIVGGVALVVAAFLSSGLAGGILLAGAGLLLTALGLGSVVLLIMYCGQFIPWLVNQCVKLGRWILGKKEQIL